MRQVTTIINIRDGGASISGDMNISLLNGLVNEVAEHYGTDKFIELLNEEINFEDAMYMFTATLHDNDEVVIDVEPPLEKKHYIAVCNVVLQAQGVGDND